MSLRPISKSTLVLVSFALLGTRHVAVAWVQKTAIFSQIYGPTASGRELTPSPGAGPIWANYYQIDTDKPIFGDRDKSIHDNVYELSSERRNGYGWFGPDPKIALDRFEKWSQQPESR